MKYIIFVAVFTKDGVYQWWLEKTRKSCQTLVNSSSPSELEKIPLEKVTVGGVFSFDENKGVLSVVYVSFHCACFIIKKSTMARGLSDDEVLWQSY